MTQSPDTRGVGKWWLSQCNVAPVAFWKCVFFGTPCRVDRRALFSAGTTQLNNLSLQRSTVQQINHNQQHELEPPSNEDIARFCLINTLSTWKTRTKLSHKLVPVCPLKEKICLRESFSFWIQKFHDFEEILAKVTETLVQQRYIRIFTIKGPGILLSPLANRLASCHDT